MKVKIYEPQEQVVRLALKEDGGTVRLTVVDANGDRIRLGDLISFCPDGTASRAMSVDPAFGFKLDDYGRIQID